MFSVPVAATAQTLLNEMQPLVKEAAGLESDTVLGRLRIWMIKRRFHSFMVAARSYNFTIAEQTVYAELVKEFKGVLRRIDIMEHGDNDFGESLIA
jgi:hypothetical protein